MQHLVLIMVLHKNKQANNNKKQFQQKVQK